MPRLDSHTTEEELLGAIAGGDQRAVEALYDRHAASVYGLALRIVRDRSRAEDIVQDTFVRAWRSAPSYDPNRARPLTWLMTIAHNVAVDAVRREASRPTAGAVGIDGIDEFADLAGPGGPGHAGAPDPARAAVQRETAGLIRSALAQIPPKQREAIELAYFSGLSQPEIADRLGEAVGTVKTRTFHGMRRLRDLLRESGVRDGA